MTLRLLLHSTLWITASVCASASSSASASDIFVDVSGAAGIRFQLVNGVSERKLLHETMLGGAGWLDYDGDGWLDLYLVQGHGDSGRAFAAGEEANVLYRNRGDGTFEDVTQKAGAGDRRYGSGVAVGDIENDGDPDLYVTNYGRNVLYRNNGDGSFTDVTDSAGVACPLWSTSAAFLDVNGDGLLDLYVANYLYYDPRVHPPCTGNPKKIPAYCHPNKFAGAPDSLFVNRGGGRFEDISKSAGIAVTGRVLSKGLGVLPTDFNGDGRADLFVANDSVPNFLWRNLGGERFEDAALEAGVALSFKSKAEACMGIDGGDINGDGRTDYVVTNYAEETDTVYLAAGEGYFDDATVRTGLASSTYTPLGFGVVLVDHDLDGDLDLYVARGHVLDNVEVLHPGTPQRYKQPDQLFENDGRGVFRDISATAGAWFQAARVGRAAAYADYDNDGDTDILVVNIGSPAVLLANRRENESRWLGLSLQGTGRSNRDAFGAQARVFLQGLPQGRPALVPLEIRSAASYLAANDARRVVGLGPAGRVERVEVRWPSGRKETFRGLKVNAYNTLVEGQGR